MKKRVLLLTQIMPYIRIKSDIKWTNFKGKWHILSHVSLKRVLFESRVVVKVQKLLLMAHIKFTESLRLVHTD